MHGKRKVIFWLALAILGVVFVADLFINISDLVELIIYLICGIVSIIAILTNKHDSESTETNSVE